MKKEETVFEEAELAAGQEVQFMEEMDFAERMEILWNLAEEQI